jgi:putative ABC transport system permease protein
MSYGLWQRRFGGDPSILGESITLGGAPYTVVGVLSPGFTPYPHAEVWTPLQADLNSTDQAHILMVSGRLPAGVSFAQANSWMAVIGKRYVQAHPQQIGDEGQVMPMQESVTGNVRPALLILLGAVGLVLLIACANVASLLLARAGARRKEIAVRAAIGAGRGRIVRQLLSESLLLALAGGAIGLVFGSAVVRVLLVLAPGDLPRVQEVASVPALDPRVAGFTVLVSVLTGVLFGLLPAIELTRTDLVASLKESSGQMGTNLRRGHTRSALVAAEVAIATILLCGAALLSRSFAALHSVSLGFDPHNVLTMEVSLAGPGYSKSNDVDRLARQFADRAERIPGVESAALSSSLPLWGGMDMIFAIPGRPPLKGREATGDVEWRIVSPQYFRVLRIPLLSGRLLNEREPGRTVVITRAMARKFWPHTNPIGQTIIIGPGLGPKFGEGLAQIVGIVGDARWTLEVGAVPTMYQVPSQVPDAAMALVNGLQPEAVLVRTRPGVAPMSVSQSVQQALQACDRLAVAKVRTMAQVALDSTARQNFNTVLLGIFAAIALLLAAVGIYGVISCSVAQRTHDIGIRIALGARRSDVLRLVVGQGMFVALIGVGIGIAGALGLTRLLSSLLFGVSPTDPLTFGIVSLTLSGVALLACYIPARRATKVDPMVALRYE